LPTIKGKVTQVYENEREGERGPYINYKAYIEGKAYSTNSKEDGKKLVEGAFVVAEYTIAGNEGQWRNLKSVIVEDENNWPSTEGEKDDMDPPQYRDSVFSNQQPKQPENALDGFVYRYARSRTLAYSIALARHPDGNLTAIDFSIEIDAMTEALYVAELQHTDDFYQRLIKMDTPAQPPGASSAPVEQSSAPSGSDAPLFPEGRVFKDLGEFLEAAHKELGLYSKDVWRLLDRTADEIDQQIRDRDSQLWSTLDYKAKNPPPD